MEGGGDNKKLRRMLGLRQTSGKKYNRPSRTTKQIVPTGQAPKVQPGDPTAGVKPFPLWSVKIRNSGHMTARFTRT